MAVEERRRAKLRRQIAATWGEEAADTLFELVTPPGQDVATKQDVRRLEERVESGVTLLRQQLEALEHRLLGTFERRIADAVTTQTRTLVLSQLAALVAIAGMAFGLR